MIGLEQQAERRDLARLIDLTPGPHPPHNPEQRSACGTWFILELAMPNQPPHRIHPEHAPDEAVERIARTRVIQEDGDVVLRREPAGILSSTSVWRYALFVAGSQARDRHFVRYDGAAIEGEQEAAKRRARLIYVENGTALLLMDHRAR